MVVFIGNKNMWQKTLPRSGSAVWECAWESGEGDLWETGALSRKLSLPGTSWPLNAKFCRQGADGGGTIRVSTSWKPPGRLRNFHQGSMFLIWQFVQKGRENLSVLDYTVWCECWLTCEFFTLWCSELNDMTSVDPRTLFEDPWVVGENMPWLTIE